MMRAITRPVVPPLIAALVFSGCYSYGPRVRRSDIAAGRYARAPSTTFGYMSAGIIARADFYGEIDGIAPGMGGTVTLPLAPGILALVAVVGILAAAAEGGVDIDLEGLDIMDEPLHSGISDPNRVVISEFSADFTLSGTRHRDEDFGGHLAYRSLLFGIRLGGPRRYVPRYYFSGGYGFYSFQYDRRPDALVTGPYVGGGLELFVDPGVTFGIDYKLHFYFGDDDAGRPVDGAAGQFSACITWYW